MFDNVLNPPMLPLENTGVTEVEIGITFTNNVEFIVNCTDIIHVFILKF